MCLSCYISEVYTSAEKEKKKNLNALDETIDQDQSFMVLTCSVSISYAALGGQIYIDLSSNGSSQRYLCIV